MAAKLESRAAGTPDAAGCQRGGGRLHSRGQFAQLRATDNIYGFFEGTAGKQVVLRVGQPRRWHGARAVTRRVPSRASRLRDLAWVEGNRRKVDQATEGRVAYVYVPNTADAGYASFNRYFFSQVGKEAAIIDERFNAGGSAARIHHRLPAPADHEPA